MLEKTALHKTPYSIPFRNAASSQNATGVVGPAQATTGSALSKLEMKENKATAAVIAPSKSEPTFLGIPRELRNQIYGHLLTFDKGPEGSPHRRRWQRNFELSILCVSQQIREEAWYIFKTTNILVNVTVVTEMGQPPKPNLLPSSKDPLLVQPYIQPSHFGPIKAEELRNSSALHIWLGESCGEDNTDESGPFRSHHDILFVYSMRTYCFFCNELAARVDEYKSISVDLNPRPHAPFEFVLKYVIHPLTMIRGAERACFRKLMQSDRLAEWAGSMMRKFQSPADLARTLLLFKSNGNDCYRAGKYAFAVCHYLICRQAIERMLDLATQRNWKFGSPSMNSVYHIIVDLHNNLAQAYHMLVLSRKVNGRFRNIEGWQLENAIDIAGGALNWAGLDDDQRGKAHFRRAVAFLDKAEYLVESSGKLFEEEKQPSKWPNAVRCYELAALDFYYAMQVDFKGEDSEMLERLYQWSRKKGEINEDPTLLQQELPGIGLWKGDPRLLKEWLTEFPVMYMLRQRAGKRGMSRVDMEAMLERAGIHFYYTSGGVLNVDALSMIPPASWT